MHFYSRHSYNVFASLTVIECGVEPEMTILVDVDKVEHPASYRAQPLRLQNFKAELIFEDSGKTVETFSEYSTEIVSWILLSSLRWSAEQLTHGE